VGPRAGLDTEARRKILWPLPGIEPPSPGRPARSQTLHCLSYPGSRLLILTRPKDKMLTLGQVLGKQVVVCKVVITCVMRLPYAKVDFLISDFEPLGSSRCCRCMDE
jgi:hypothetical protein